MKAEKASDAYVKFTNVEKERQKKEEAEKQAKEDEKKAKEEEEQKKKDEEEVRRSLSLSYTRRGDEAHASVASLCESRICSQH